MKRFTALFFGFALFAPFLFLSAQNEEVLFTVDDLVVTTDEFQYVFEKNNRGEAKPTKDDLKEYLDLYINFKLKVKAAKELGMDSLQQIQEELNSYRRQLARNYLLDKQLQENVARQTYERKKTELEIAHILIDYKDEKGKKKAQQLLDSLKQLPGADFGDLAEKYSEDPGSKKQSGNIGYLSAPFARGFEQVEDTAYHLQINETGGPVDSEMGLHLIKVLDKRPALGRLELSHVFVRRPAPRDNDFERESKRKKEKIQEAYDELQNGASFKHVALKYSEDDNSKYNDGYLGFITTNTYEDRVEDAVYALEEMGDYTEPVSSSLGWHIFKRGEKVRPQDFSFEDSRAQILSDLKKTNRLDVAQEALIEEIKKEAPFILKSNWLDTFRASLSSDFTTYKWEIPEINTPVELFSFGEKVTKTNADFLKFLKRKTRERMRLDRKMKAKEALNHLFDSFVDEAAIEYEESQLEQKYPEFKHLMKEYEEGILLFEITKNEVWDKAPKDTLGLRKFYEKNKENYQWNDRARVYSFTLKAEDEKSCEKITNQLLRKGVRKTIEATNKKETLLTYTTETLEKGKSDKAISWQEGVLFDVQNKDEECTFEYIEEIIPAQTKKLEEARGYVISDYQSELEEQWVKSLRSRYKVKINNKTLKSVKKEYQ
jgi:peptidyl-prolyl cis-trans isomerase SurA